MCGRRDHAACAASSAVLLAREAPALGRPVGRSGVGGTFIREPQADQAGTAHQAKRVP